MDYQIQFFPELDLVVEQIEGEITLDGLLHKTQELLTNPKYKKGLFGAIDLRKAHTQMSKADLQSFAGLMNESEDFKASTWAIIGNDPLVIALSQVFQKQMNNRNSIGVFGSVQSAAKFLEKPQLRQILSDS